MDFAAESRVRAPAAQVWVAVRDLATYPGWFSIVDRAEPSGGAGGGDDVGGWLVDLVGRLGPLKRTKRLRMRRVIDDGDARHVRFERDDGPGHSAWVLDGTVIADRPDDTSCLVLMQLHYGGGLFVPGADLLLRYEARNAGGRLERLLRAASS
jgi:hypothetical protein